VSLIVGGINIMNVMLIAVRERTREIGVRMAIGARQADILKQFLVEAVVLSTMGGGVGIVLGMLLTHGLIRSFTEWQATISLSAIGISVVFSAGVGIFFGLYPAWKASQLDPIEALRFE
jgi:putative ABC transport system permease protein